MAKAARYAGSRLDKRLLKLRQLPQDDVVLIRAYVEKHPELLQYYVSPRISLPVERGAENVFSHRPGRQTGPVFDV